MNESTRTQVEAAAFRRLLEHFRGRTDVQNVDVMNLAGFCRNCLAKWYSAAAQERGLDIEYAKAQELIYGMAYPEWKEKNQTPASPEQLAKMAERQSFRDLAGH